MPPFRLVLAYRVRGSFRPSLTKILSGNRTRLDGDAPSSRQLTHRIAGVLPHIVANSASSLTFDEPLNRQGARGADGELKAQHSLTSRGSQSYFAQPL